MERRHNTSGGGAQTNINGFKFERDTDLLKVLSGVDYLTIEGNNVYFENKKIGACFKKNNFYKDFLVPMGINYKERISKRLLPDAVFVNYISRKVVIFEKKYQERAGSVDEKLQTCDFKKKRYECLLEGTGYTVSYVYVLSEWFLKDEYKDVKEYIKDTGCDYCFSTIPPTLFGIARTMFL